MAEVLVTGGTGALGRVLVPALRAAGHGVRVLSRRPGEGRLAGDVATGAGLAAAVDGVDAVVHLASDPDGDYWTADVAGTRRVAVAAREAGVTHLVYVSIPGVDRVPHPFYRAKFAAEQVVEAAAVPYTILRATQFHGFLADLLARGRRGPVVPAGIGWSFQPVDTRDVAAHLTGLLAAGPAAGIVEYGGPEVLDSVALARSWLAARGGRGRVIPLPVPGKFTAAARAGDLLPAADAPRGTITWEQWLRNPE